MQLEPTKVLLYDPRRNKHASNPRKQRTHKHTHTHTNKQMKRKKRRESKMRNKKSCQNITATALQAAHLSATKQTAGKIHRCNRRSSSSRRQTANLATALLVRIMASSSRTLTLSETTQAIADGSKGNT